MSTKKNIRAYLNSKDIATTMTGFVNEERRGGRADKELIYQSANGQIIHDLANNDIILTKANGDSITIADRNVGATQVWNYGDTLSSANCGSLFQWGNNYEFTHPGTSDRIICATTTQQVDVTSYGWDNPYSSEYFYNNEDVPSWMASTNSDLWGDTTNTDIARRGPCASGYHIPSSEEVEKLINYFDAIVGGGTHYISNVSLFVEYLKLPLTGENNYVMPNTYRVGEIACYFTSAHKSDSANTYVLFIRTEKGGTSSDYREYYLNEYTYDSTPCPIRPFKNL